MSKITKKINKKLLRMLHGSRCFTGRFSRKEPPWPPEAKKFGYRRLAHANGSIFYGLRYDADKENVFLDKIKIN